MKEDNIRDNISDLVSVIIRTWNREKDLRETLNILKAEPYKPLQIIIVDNGSMDNTVKMVLNNFPEVELIKLPKNIGVAATNIGIKKARGKYLLFLDDDSFPEAGSVSLAIKKFEENPELGIVAFKTIDSTMATGFWPGLKFEKGMTADERKCGIKIKIFLGGANMIRHVVVEKVGDYPEKFFFCGEESDLAMRAIYAGYEIRYFPELVVFHRASLQNRSSSKKMYFTTRNLLWLYWKYSPIIMALLKTIHTLIFMGIKSLKNGTAISYFRGSIDGIKELPEIMKQRQVVYTQTIHYAIMHNLLKKRLRK